MKNRRNAAKIMFTKMLKTGHFLVFVIFGKFDNQLLALVSCLASGGGVNT